MPPKQNKNKNNKQPARRANPPRRNGNPPRQVTYPTQANRPAPTNQRVTTLLADVKNGPLFTDSIFIAPHTLSWVSTVAACHQQWRMVNPKVWFEPAVGTDAQGVLHMSLAHDGLDKPPTTPIQFMNTSRSVRKSVGNRIALPISSTGWKNFTTKNQFTALDDSEKESRMAARLTYLVEGVPTGGDKGVPAGGLIGRIYMEFTPEFKSPIDPSLQLDGSE